MILPMYAYKTIRNQLSTNKNETIFQNIYTIRKKYIKNIPTFLYIRILGIQDEILKNSLTDATNMTKKLHHSSKNQDYPFLSLLPKKNI